MTDSDRVIQSFQRTFGAAPSVVARAPGRVNLIGEHTDYQGGLVLPFAVDRSVLVASGPGRAGMVRARSEAFDDAISFPLDVDRPATKSTWQNYLRGAVHGLRASGLDLPGVDLLIAGDLPPACGLSSSAALTVASTTALAALVHVALSPLELIDHARRAEHDFAGTPCGLMDPYAIVFSTTGHAILLDCRTRQHETVPVETPGYSFLLIHSGVSRKLAAGAYQERVAESSSAASKLAAAEPSVRTLRDANWDLLEKLRHRLAEVEIRRVRHIITENQRVREAVDALRRHNAADLGRLLSQSHESLRSDYDVSCPEVESLITLLSREPDVAGARMIGGGFGGCLLALVRQAAVDKLRERLTREYNSSQGAPTPCFPVSPSGGAGFRRLA